MSGHSKWSNIKHKKGKADAQKGKVFTKLGRELLIASRACGGDVNDFRLKIAIENAKAQNVPNENIQRAIQKGAGGAEGANYEELRYEGYGPGGVAIMIDILTDNRNRTAGEVRHIFSKNGGNMGETGSVGWMFEDKGQLRILREGLKLTEDDLMMMALEAGAEDFEADEEGFVVLTAPSDMEAVRQALIDQNIPIEESVLSPMPQNTIEITDPDQARKIVNLMNKLEDHDDSQGVYSNFDLAEDLGDI
ncbi:DNA-binding regulatory protein, YebC/PmpR family [Desulfosporosinus orientis DSM 765]|uniref:Probable transcriptional regulatory protein Desor_0919 n=1 Tax=Desulfosporosinus orientis (strain ATCC 19365 / DSM 765 / NCIMB 8382 / VKM B-1628 / Singapore I) TaxID=768706 RepID=G7WCQ7_DESOD|nr:YebC/PmpR family DNA-binding transcriptional regulator [Desulfosporosinus orientis]AET66595.1 DNA-binding regulatory protein, YebC/PmpR family [Desulfosporosinus orientis DSM 765]